MSPAFFFGKDETHPQAVGFDIFSNDFAAVLFHDVLRQGKSQAGTGLVCAGVGTIKGGKNMRKLHFIDTRAVVGNIDNPVFAVLSDMGLNGAAFRTVVDGVADNVVKGAVQIAFVGTDYGIFRDFRVNCSG